MLEADNAAGGWCYSSLAAGDRFECFNNKRGSEPPSWFLARLGYRQFISALIFDVQMNARMTAIKWCEEAVDMCGDGLSAIHTLGKIYGFACFDIANLLKRSAKQAKGARDFEINGNGVFVLILIRQPP